MDESLVSDEEKENDDVVDQVADQLEKVAPAPYKAEIESEKFVQAFWHWDDFAKFVKALAAMTGVCAILTLVFGRF